jgi:hypothetical protein
LFGVGITGFIVSAVPFIRVHEPYLRK